MLIALDALLSERSVTRAARKLGLSQPALSAQLAKLRLLFNDSLLVGNAHGMIPTPRAVELQEPLHLLLGDLQALVMSQTEFDPATAQRTFGITATDYVHATVTRPLVSVLPEIAPAVRIAALPLSKERVRDQLADGTADLCITAERLTPADFPARKLRHERFVLILSKSHPGATKPMPPHDHPSPKFGHSSIAGYSLFPRFFSLIRGFFSLICRILSHSNFDGRPKPDVPAGADVDVGAGQSRSQATRNAPSTMSARKQGPARRRQGE